MSSIINMTFLITFFLTILTFSSANHHPKEKETNLQFYYHELLAGPNKTLLTVVRQNSTALGSFGDVSVFDDNLRAGPEQYSKVIGYSQGTAVQSSQHRGLEFVLNMNWFFTEGKYNGSSLAVFGRAAFTDVRELSIVGGTGVFRLARGVVIGRPLDAPPASFIISYDVQVTNLLIQSVFRSSSKSSSTKIFGPNPDQQRTTDISKRSTSRSEVQEPSGVRRI